MDDGYRFIRFGVSGMRHVFKGIIKIKTNWGEGNKTDRK